MKQIIMCNITYSNWSNQTEFNSHKSIFGTKLGTVSLSTNFTPWQGLSWCYLCATLYNDVWSFFFRLSHVQTNTTSAQNSKWKTPNYLRDKLPSNRSYMINLQYIFQNVRCRTMTYSNSFLPYHINLIPLSKIFSADIPRS